MLRAYPVVTEANTRTCFFAEICCVFVLSVAIADR
jgi:hypothetical protein